ncbi:murein hydrolase activator EnvC family protein [Candidatus Zixiibacteriota bacterium]
MRVILRFVGSICLATMAGLALLQGVSAQSTANTEQQVVERQLQQIEKKIEEKTDSIEGLAEREGQAQAKSRALREEIEITAEVQARLKATSQKLGSEYLATDRRAQKLKEQQLYRQEILARTITKLYATRSAPGSAAYIGGEMHEKRRQLLARIISAAHSDQLIGVTDSLAAEQQQRAELARTRDQVQSSAAKKEKEKENKERLLSKSDRAAFGYRQQREQELDDIEQIQRDALILGELIDRLAALPGVQEAIDYDFPGWQGRLHWPLTGTVKSTVGRKIDNKYKTETFETGIFIAGTVGMVVANAADGEVAYAGRRRGLGNVVVVGHGQTYFSVFAHLGEISVIIGQVLRAGDPVGTAGESHPRFGSGILFELRHEKEILDPLEWLK